MLRMQGSGRIEDLLESSLDERLMRREIRDENADGARGLLFKHRTCPTSGLLDLLVEISAGFCWGELTRMR